MFLEAVALLPFLAIGGSGKGDLGQVIQLEFSLVKGRRRFERAPGRLELGLKLLKCRDTLGAKLNIRYLSQFAVDLPEFKSYVSYFFFLSYAQKLNFFSRRFMGLPDETSFLSVHDRNPRSSTTQNLV